MNEDQIRADREKEIRVALKQRGYGYAEMVDELGSQGFLVGLHADHATFTIEAVKRYTSASGVIIEEPVATARMSRYTARALDRGARQVRAQLEVDDEIGVWRG